MAKFKARTRLTFRGSTDRDNPAYNEERVIKAGATFEPTKGMSIDKMLERGIIEEVKERGSG